MRRHVRLPAALLAAGFLILAAAPAGAASEAVAEVKTFRDWPDRIEFQLSLQRGGDAVTVDPHSVQVRWQPARGSGAGTLPNPEVAENASISRAVMLVLDTSGSTAKQHEITAEKQAALRFLRQLRGSQIQVGLVAFGDPAKILVQPTERFDKVAGTIGKLTPKGDTAMFQAVTLATYALRSFDYGSVLMISDGHNEDKVRPVTGAEQARKALIGQGTAERPDIGFSGVLVGDERRRDIFAIPPERTGADVVQAADRAAASAALQQVVARGVDQARKVVKVRIPVPEAYRGRTGNITISARGTDGRQYTAQEFTFTFKRGGAVTAPASVRGVSALGAPALVVAMVALFAGLTALIATATGALFPKPAEEATVVRRLEVYSVAGREPEQVAVKEQVTTRLGDSPLVRSAVGLMTRIARRSRIEQALDGRLEAAGLPLRTAEWMLLHVGSAVGTALVFLVLGRGRGVAAVLGLLLGLSAPWLVLHLGRSRRERRFLSQLPDTLQLLAGSLAAGYSLPQSMDSVVRESRAPISTEFNRALIEARLGRLPEDALEGIARRTASQDFSWIVMAIRIQREVGGNLAELLSNVAATLRERERLRRQVDALSAEGRLSGVILGALPVVFGVYLLLAQPDYIAPLFSTRMGVAMLVLGLLLLVAGGFWMSRVIKVQV